MVHHYLIAEDDQNMRVLIQRAYGSLVLQDVSMHYVEDGQEAIDYLAGDSQFSDRAKFPLPTLLLLDFKMPRKSGLDVLTWVRQSPLKEIVVVMFSGSDAEADVHQAYKWGANFIHSQTDFFRRPQTRLDRHSSLLVWVQLYSQSRRRDCSPTADTV